MSTSPLFRPLPLAKLPLPNRVVMAPMTRSRAAQPGDIPTPLMAEYYAQRAGAGLIISEATQISPRGKGYSFTPGIHSQAQIDGWKRVTEAVHQNGGRIFLQLWHVGRMSHPSLHTDGQTVAPSALAPDAQVWIVGDDDAGRMLDCPVPRAMTIDEIHATVEDYRQAALNAMAAGFDGVEVHGGNGYLIDQFLRRSANRRTDEYGGSQANRIRFVTEVVESISNAIGADKIGVRLAPFITQRGMDDSEAINTILLAAGEFNRIGIAYLHLAEADWDDAPTVTRSFRRDLRSAFSGAIVVAGNYHKASAETLINEGLVDAVAFGRAFIANPDLAFRMERNLPLTDIGDPSTLFGGNHKGYTDYPDYHQQLKRSLI